MKENQNCGCSDGCCQPKKKSRLWKIIIFCIIILSAGTIIAAKLANKEEAKQENCCSVPKNASCCPQTVSGKAPSCCDMPAATPSCCSEQPSAK